VEIGFNAQTTMLDFLREPAKTKWNSISKNSNSAGDCVRMAA